MAIQSGDLWRLANTFSALSKNPDLDQSLVEPFQRLAIGRAYYAAYHRALIYARDLGFMEPEEGTGSHAALWLWFTARRGEFTLVGNLGFAMHRRRKSADYKLNEVCPAVDDQIEEGEIFDETLGRLEELANQSQE